VCVIAAGEVDTSTYLFQFVLEQRFFVQFRRVFRKYCEYFTALTYVIFYVSYEGIKQPYLFFQDYGTEEDAQFVHLFFFFFLVPFNEYVSPTFSTDQYLVI
jgi:hypothetical protein